MEVNSSYEYQYGKGNQSTWEQKNITVYVIEQLKPEVIVEIKGPSV